MEKQSQSCRGAGLRREKDGGGHAAGLESRAVVCQGSRIQQMLRAPACSMGKQDVGGGWEGVQGICKRAFPEALITGLALQPI